MTNQKVIKEIANDLIHIQLDIHIWSGRRHLTKEDLIEANPDFQKLPEKDLATLGAVKICDPEKIKQFQAIKNQADSVLARAGLRFMKGTGIPRAKYPDVCKELMALETKYTDLAKAFVNDFDNGVAAWKMKHLLLNPAWAPLFRNLPTAAHVGGRLSFDWHPLAVSAPSGNPLHPELDAKFNQEIGGLKGELIREVCVEATAFVESLFKDKDGVVTQRDFVTPKTLGPLVRAADKLEAFAFIDPEIGPLAAFVQGLLKDIPEEGRIDGMKLMQLSSIARQMQDQRSISRLSRFAMDGWTPSQVVGGLQGADTSAVEAEQVAGPQAGADMMAAVHEAAGQAGTCEGAGNDMLEPAVTQAPALATATPSTEKAVEEAEPCWL